MQGGVETFEAKTMKPHFSFKQKELKERNGTPAEFAVAVYQCVPSTISMDEAALAVAEYCAEWNDAACPCKQPTPEKP